MFWKFGSLHQRHVKKIMLSMHPPRSSSACCGCLLLLSLCLSTVLAHNEPHALSLINSRAITVQPDASVSISVTPTSVDDDGYVTVSFSAPSPSKLDFVAAYSPPDVSVTETAPVCMVTCYKQSHSQFVLLLLPLCIVLTLSSARVTMRS